MKMRDKDFKELKADCERICKFYSFWPKTPPQAWRVFASVWKNRGFDDTHPAFAQGIWNRVLPYTGRGVSHYYDTLGLNDDHIRTALKRIFPDAFKEAA